MTMRRMSIALVLVVASTASALANDEPPATEPPPEPPPETPFDRGKLGVGIYGGSQTTLGHRYFAIGGSVGYFVLDGVEVGLGALHQFGGGPSISKLTPSLRYVAQPLVGHSPVIPYAGVFYNHWFIGDDISDVDTLGTRGGLLMVSGKLILGLGVVFEKIVSTCETDCTAVYPDFTISLSL